MLDPISAPPSIARIFKPLANHLGLATLPLHAHEIIASYAAYNVLFTFVAPAASKALFPSTYPKFDRRTRINWDARFVSQVQQVVILGLVAYELLCDPARRTQTWQTRLWGYDGMTGLVQALAAGYFAWDVQVSAVNMDVLGADSLAHAFGWLAITFMGFVSASFPFSHSSSLPQCFELFANPASSHICHWYQSIGCVCYPGCFESHNTLLGLYTAPNTPDPARWSPS